VKPQQNRMLPTHLGVVYPKEINHTSYSELEKAVLSNNPRADCRLIRDAYDYARKVHALQKRDEGAPYFVHPYRVTRYLTDKMNVGDDKIIATALLHDVMEDGDHVTLDDLVSRFGYEVAHNVKLLSKPKKGSGMCKFVRDKIYHDRIRKAPRELKRVKIADRLDNIRFLHLSPDKKKQKQYAEETRKVYLPIAKKYFKTAFVEMEGILRKFK